MKNLIYLFLFTQMFTNAFAISPFVTIALGISIILFVLGIKKNVFSIAFKEPPFLTFFFLVLFVGYVFIATGEKKTNHFLMWTIPAFLYYYIFRRELYKLFTLEQIKGEVLKVITFSLLFACFFAIVEFLLVNLLGNDMSFIPRGMREEYAPTAMASIRARSFMEESGYFSFYWELFAPLGVYWINKNISNILKKYICYSIILTGLILSFSAYGFVCLLLWGISLFFFNLKSAKNSRTIVTTFFCVIVIILLVILLVPEIYELFSFVIGGKLDPENSSHSDRASRFEVLRYLDVTSIIIGYGPNAAGTLKFDNSFMSFYLGALMNTGVLGLACFGMFLLNQLKYVRKMSDRNLKLAFFLSLWFSSMHLMFIDIIYVPWFWVMLSLLGVTYFKEKDMLKRLDLGNKKFPHNI